MEKPKSSRALLDHPLHLKQLAYVKIEIEICGGCREESLRPCFHSHSYFHNYHWSCSSKDEYHDDAGFVSESIDLCFIGDIHCHCIAFSSDRNGDVQGRQHDLGNGHAQQRQGHVQHIEVSSGVSFDHRSLWRQHKLQRKHVICTHTDCQQGELDDDLVVLRKSLHLRFFGEVHCYGCPFDLHRNRHL